MIIGWICIGAGFGVLLSGILWWNAAYAAGYRDGCDDVGAVVFGGGDDVEAR
jgi:hypothetical protein